MNTVQPIRSKMQVIEMINYLKEKNDRDYILFVFGIYSGLRISDILPLKVSDVRNKSRLHIHEKKTGKEKIISLNEELRNALAEYTKEMKDWEFLFPSRQRKSKLRKDKETKPMTRQRAIQILKQVASEFNIEDIGTHSLRKTFGYHLYNQTKDVATIQAIFGHSSALITLRYIGVDQDKKDKLVKGLSFT